MYHSLYFGFEENWKNTWDDWHIVPTTRPKINPPNINTNYIDIPGVNGNIDITETLRGFPTYSNRTGSIEFLIMNDYQEWFELYSEIMTYLHGRKMQMVLEDDIAYYYEGRFNVSAFDSSGPHNSKITIDYNVNPFKISRQSTCDDWIWDPFNFSNGIITQDTFKGIEVPSLGWYKDDYAKYIGMMPTQAKIIVESNDGNGIPFYFVNKELGISIDTTLLPDGITENPNYIFSNQSMNNTIIMATENGHPGKISIDFHVGRF